MAVTKIWQVKDSLFRVLDYCNNPEKTKLGDLQQVIRYAADEDKTENTDEQFHAVTGINCNADTAFEEMRDVQERYGKTGGNIAYHAYQSFKTGEVTAEQCHRLGVELAQKMWGDNYQVLVATHFNTGTFHNHFIVNAVGMWDGKKYDCSEREYYRMRRLSDEMCARESLTVIEHPGKRASRTMYNAEKNGEPTKFNLMREAIDYALSMSWDKNTFITMMRAQGYVFSFNPNRKYATIRSVNSSKATRLYRLGEEYDRPAVLQRLAENREYDLRQVQSRYNDFNEPYFSYDWVQLHPPKRDYFYRTHFYYTDLRYRSLAEIYATLFSFVLDITIEMIKLICELIYEQAMMPRLVAEVKMKAKSPEMKAAQRFFEKYNRQMLLMAEAKFTTERDVGDYIAQHEIEIDKMKSAREHWRNKLRNAKTPEQIAEYKQKRDKCTYYLNRLRLQKETAQSILNGLPHVRYLLRSEQNIQRALDPYEHNKGYRMIDVIENKEGFSR